MRKTNYVFRKYFLILATFVSALIVVITLLIYHSAATVIETEVLNTNEVRVIQTENNLLQALERTKRLAASICVDTDTNVFWIQEDPEATNGSIYDILHAKLQSNVYSFKDFIYSVMLYSPRYQRIFTDKMYSPYVLTGRENDCEYDIEWIKELRETSNDANVEFINRRYLNQYPYVLTMIMRYEKPQGWGAVAVDLDLKALYRLACSDTQNTEYWVINDNNQVLACQNQTDFFTDASNVEMLKLFSSTHDNFSCISKLDNSLVAYTQEYCEEYGLYVVGATVIDEYRANIQAEKAKAIVIGLGGVLVSCLLVWAYVSFTNKPISGILDVLKSQTGYGDNAARSSREIQKIADEIVRTIQRNGELSKELENRITILRETQLLALKAQINPHFLFNTLNIIVLLIEEELENSKAAEVTVDLADILRYCLDENTLVSLSEEVEYTKKYLYILEQRYRDDIQIQYEIDSALREIMVPKLIFQPLIENAVFHGLSSRDDTERKTLVISGRLEPNESVPEKSGFVHLAIADNGVGMPEKEIKRIMDSLENEYIGTEHVGVANVAKRIKLIYPQNSKLEIQSKPNEGTCVSMYFPFDESCHS